MGASGVQNCTVRICAVGVPPKAKRSTDGGSLSSELNKQQRDHEPGFAISRDQLGGPVSVSQQNRETPAS